MYINKFFCSFVNFPISFWLDNIQFRFDDKVYYKKKFCVTFKTSQVAIEWKRIFLKKM